MSKTVRDVAGILPGEDTSDGAGVKLKRSLGGPRLQHFDPFLLLDEFRSDQAGDYIAGFPDHPHRGFETVTYMLAGRMRHRDNQGNSGLLQPGGAQWMTAGRGIVHSEMPEQEDGLMWGFQLWVNLPSKDKMVPPRYQDIDPADVPEVEAADGARVRVVAGTVEGVTGPVSDIAVQPTYLDVTLQPGQSFTHGLPESHNAFAYVYGGSLTIAGKRAVNGDMVLLGPGDTFAASHEGAEETRFLLIAGQPIGEPVARYGPFVMNTRDEIIQAFQDYEAGRFV